MLFLKEARSRLYDSEKLSNLELLTLILNNEGLAQHVYQIIGGDLTNLTRETLDTVSGLGETLISRLLAAVQLSYHTRLQAAEKNQITSPHDAAQILIPCFAGLEQEHLRVLCLNTKNRVMANELIYKGNVNSSIIRSSEVFRSAILRTCPSIIIAHNHPSLEISVSPEDLDVTKALVQAGKILGVELLDHLIIAGDKWRSLKTDYLHLF